MKAYNFETTVSIRPTLKDVEAIENAAHRESFFTTVKDKDGKEKSVLAPSKVTLRFSFDNATEDDVKKVLAHASSLTVMAQARLRAIGPKALSELDGKTKDFNVHEMMEESKRGLSPEVKAERAINAIGTDAMLNILKTKLKAKGMSEKEIAKALGA